MPPRSPIILSLLLLAACATTQGPPTEPNDREWNVLGGDYASIESLRKALPAPPANASRKQMIEITLANLQRIEPQLNAFIAKASEYYERTHDPRAAQVLAREKVIMGDQYLGILSRYDRALQEYRAALALEPNNPDIQKRIEMAEGRRFVQMSSFAAVKNGMKEDDVRRLVGLPREDWIKQVVQNNRVYSVWIYPKEDGGASAIYFDNGVVYHTNWNAAAPPAASASGGLDAAAPAAGTAALPNTPIYAQLLSTLDQKTADTLAAKLIDGGFTSAYVERGSGDKGTMFKVRVKFPSEVEARSAE